jgi:hypothetical protein
MGRDGSCVVRQPSCLKGKPFDSSAFLYVETDDDLLCKKGGRL